MKLKSLSSVEVVFIKFQTSKKLNGKQTKGGKKIWITKVDADANSEQAQVHGIQGFPTIKVFNGGKVSEYKGGRDMHSIESFASNL